MVTVSYHLLSIKVIVTINYSPAFEISFIKIISLKSAIKIASHLLRLQEVLNPLQQSFPNTI